MRLVLAADLGAQVVLDNAADVDIDGLVHAGQRCCKVAEFLSVVGNITTQHLERNDAGLAVWALLKGLEDADLIHLS